MSEAGSEKVMKLPPGSLGTLVLVVLSCQYCKKAWAHTKATYSTHASIPAEDPGIMQ